MDSKNRRAASLCSLERVVRRVTTVISGARNTLALHMGE